MILPWEYRALRNFWKVVKEAENLNDKSGRLREELERDFSTVQDLVTNFNSFVGSLGSNLDDAEYHLLNVLKDRIIGALVEIKYKLGKSQ